MRTERSRAQRSTERKRRTGLGIIEVLVALVLLTVGLLGVAGACARSIRMNSAAARERRASQRAADRVAVLASQGCAAARSGTFVDPVSSLSESWSVIPSSAAGAALVDARVQWTSSTGARAVTIRSAILC